MRLKVGHLFLVLFFYFEPASTQQFHLLQAKTESGGAWSSSSSGYSMGATVGQLGAFSSSPNYVANSGFWGEYEALVGFYASSVVVSNGWNLISVGKTVGDFRKASLFPAASSAAFTYEGGYMVRDTLENGLGYWLKFPGTQYVGINGTLRMTDTMEVVKGWNLIGSISGPVFTETILQIPPGVVSSEYYGYKGAYYPATSIEPGQAYWVKVSASGKLVLSVSLTKTHEAPVGIGGR